MHKHLRRLEQIWVDSPIYFVTTCTKHRRQLLARSEVAGVLIEEWRAARDRHGWAVGRYVIMPDHVHFFSDLNMMRKHCQCLSGRGKDGLVGKFTDWKGRGQRPRLQYRYGKANF